MSERINGRIIEIDPKKKYALLVKEKMSDGELRRIVELLDQFMKSDKTFIVMNNSQIEIIDLDEEKDGKK